MVRNSNLKENIEKENMVGYWRWNFLKKEGSWSDNFYEIFEWDKDKELSFDIYTENIHPDDIVVFLKKIKEINSNKQLSPFSHRFILKSGKVKTVFFAGQALTDKQGEVVEIIGTCQVISGTIESYKHLRCEELNDHDHKIVKIFDQVKVDRRRVVAGFVEDSINYTANKKILKKKNQQLNLAEKIALVKCWVLNLKTNKFEWSDSTYKVFDFDIETFVDIESLFKCIPVEEHEGLILLMKKFEQTKVFEKFTHSLRRKDGSLRKVEVLGKVITNEENEAVEFIGSTRDITEELRVQQQILDTNKSLKESTIKLSARNKQLAEFNQISSHNLRAPVGNLNTLLDLYKESENENEKSEIFDKFGTVVDHLTLTLDTLVESLEIKNNPNQILTKLSFDDVLNKTKEILRAEILKTGAIINGDFGVKANVQYSQVYLESIFLNLIGNAIKYSSPDRIPEITITSNLVDKKITLEIKDNGLGIDLKKHGHKLFGLNKVFHRHPEAKGVGLFLTRAQIETMGGNIHAKSDVGIGTTFYITLN